MDFVIIWHKPHHSNTDHFLTLYFQERERFLRRKKRSPDDKWGAMVKLKSTFIGFILYLVLVLVKGKWHLLNLKCISIHALRHWEIVDAKMWNSISDLAECVAQSDAHYGRSRGKRNFSKFYYIFKNNLKTNNKQNLKIHHISDHGQVIFGKISLLFCLNLNRFHFSYFAHLDDGMLHEMHIKNNLNAKKPHIDAFNHRFGHGRTTNTHQTSSFLLHTPYEALRSTISAPSRYLHHETQTPPSILMKRRLSKPHTTTTMQTVTSTPLRGDQQPQTDDENSYGSDEIVLLGNRNQPVTMAPYYFFNERDKTERRIAWFPLSIWVFAYVSWVSMFLFDNINSWLPETPAQEPVDSPNCFFFLLCVYIKWSDSFSNILTIHRLHFSTKSCSGIICKQKFIWIVSKFSQVSMITFPTWTIPNHRRLLYSRKQNISNDYLLYMTNFQMYFMVHSNRWRHSATASFYII